MSYIRTKDTIFEVVEKKELVYVVKSKKDPKHTYSKSKSALQFIQYADTIEELINKYITIDRYGHKKIYTRYRFEQLSRTEVLNLMIQWQEYQLAQSNMLK